MSDGQKFYLGINGEQAGPFSEEEVRAKMQAGEVSSESLVWYEGLAEWQPIGSVTYFNPSASAPPAPGDAAPPAEPEEEAREKTIAAVAAPAPMQGGMAGKFKPLSQVLNSPSAGAPAPKADDEADSSDAEEPEPSISGFAGRGVSRPPPDREPERHEPAWKKKGAKPSAPEKGEVILTFALHGKKPRAVFGAKEGVFSAASSRMGVVLGSAAAVCALGFGAFYLYLENSENNLPTEVVVKKIEPRDVRLTRAKDNVILNPALGVTELQKLLAENNKDSIGKSAYQALELYFWEKQDYKGLGDLAMGVGEHTKAVEFYLKDPRLVVDAEKAYIALFGSATDLAIKKKALLAQIEILLGPLKRKKDAITQIQLFEKTFPGEPHPYQFYTLPPSKQIAELFERTSYYFLANLNGFIDGEFPHMKLATSPVVEVRKEGDRYRVTGSYKGEVRLYRDKLKGVFLHFWLIDGQWYVTETNITADRKRYAAEKKEQLFSKTSDENAMLKYLESVFNQEFPRTPLHERAPRNTAASAPRGEDSP
jgi:hypothetical protein